MNCCMTSNIQGIPGAVCMHLQYSYKSHSAAPNASDPYYHRMVLLAFCLSLFKRPTVQHIHWPLAEIPGQTLCSNDDGRERPTQTTLSNPQSETLAAMATRQSLLAVDERCCLYAGDEGARGCTGTILRHGAQQQILTYRLPVCLVCRRQAGLGD